MAEAQILQAPSKDMLFQLPTNDNRNMLNLTTFLNTKTSQDLETDSSVSRNFSLLTPIASASSSSSLNEAMPSTASTKSSRPFDALDQDLEKSTNRKRQKINCTYPGCNRSFNRPAKLKEHLVSHEGKRPFVCNFEGCSASFVREVNFQTHQRTHKPMEERPLACTADGCQKRFWTAQHLRRHVEQAHGGLKCPYCVQTFKKHFQLRAHALSEHAIDEKAAKKDRNPDGGDEVNNGIQEPSSEKDIHSCSSEGTTSTAILLPFECPQEGCDKRFPNRAKLRAHAKRHDSTRYACFHNNCLENGAPPHFQTWTALQSHHKTIHPPICPHTECNGRKFQREDQLRNHLRTHSEGRQLRKPRIQRTSWLCPIDGCEEEFQLQPQLRKHLSVHHPEFQHTEETKFAKIKTVRIPCTHAQHGCTFHARTLTLLETHMENVHGEQLLEETRMEMATLDQQQQEQQQLQQLMMTNQLTGAAMLETWQGRTIQCPWMVTSENTADFNEDLTQTRCKHWFKRVYDLQRHLAHIHKHNIERDQLKRWLQDLHVSSHQQNESDNITLEINVMDEE